MTPPAHAPPQTAAGRRWPPAARPRRPRRWAPAVTVAVIGVFAFGPVYWLLVTALTPNDDAFAFPPRLWPRAVTLEHFANLADNPVLGRYLVNSLIVSLLTAVLTVIVAAYTGTRSPSSATGAGGR